MNNNKITKYVLITISILIILTITALIFIGNYFFNYALVRNDDGKTSGSNRNVNFSTSSYNQEIIHNNFAIQKEKTNHWLKNIDREELYIKSNDGLTLVGTQFNTNGSDNWAILAHGYTSNQTDMYDVAQNYSENGYNVLTIDLRSHGNSEGKYIGMGWLDKEDMLIWINKLLESHPNAKIVLHGISMGAATVMMTSGEKLPSNVKAIVEDCGYTSVWNIFSSELKVRYNFPSFPILNFVSLVTKIRAGYYLREASSLNQIKECITPTLFIHGTEDNFVPFDMVYSLYNAAQCDKDILVIEGAGHAECKFFYPNIYYGKTFEFVNKYVK